MSSNLPKNQQKIPGFMPYNLFVTSKIEFSNPPILESAAEKPKSLLKPHFNVVLVLIYYLNRYSKHCFLILEAFCSTLNSRSGGLENSIFDVTNRALIGKKTQENARFSVILDYVVGSGEYHFGMGK